MKRKIRRTKNHQIFKTIVCTASLTALVCFGVFCVSRYLESREQDEQTDNDTPTEMISVAEYQNAENNNQTSSNTTVEKIEEVQKTEKDDPIEEDTKAEAEAASQPKETTKNESGLKVAEPVVMIFSNLSKNGTMTGNEKASDIDFSGEVPNILDEEGTCIFVFSNGSKTITKETGVVRNSTYVICKHDELTLAPNELSAGEWTVQLKYKSKYAEGESEKEKFKVN